MTDQSVNYHSRDFPEQRMLTGHGLRAHRSLSARSGGHVIWAGAGFAIEMIVVGAVMLLPSGGNPAIVATSTGFEPPVVQHLSVVPEEPAVLTTSVDAPRWELVARSYARRQSYGDVTALTPGLVAFMQEQDRLFASALAEEAAAAPGPVDLRLALTERSRNRTVRIDSDFVITAELRAFIEREERLTAGL